MSLKLFYVDPSTKKPVLAAAVPPVLKAGDALQFGVQWCKTADFAGPITTTSLITATGLSKWEVRDEAGNLIGSSTGLPTDVATIDANSNLKVKKAGKYLLLGTWKNIGGLVEEVGSFIEVKPATSWVLPAVAVLGGGGLLAWLLLRKKSRR